MGKSETAEWKASQNRQPPAPWRLIVQGRPMMPSPNHTPSLARATSQGKHPRVLVLDLTGEGGSEISILPTDRVPVRYEEGGTEEFDEVMIVSRVHTEPDATIGVEVSH